MPEQIKRIRDTSWFLDLIQSATDSEYQFSAARHRLRGDPSPRRLPAAIAAFVSFAMVGIGFSAVAYLASHTRPAADSTRLELIQRVTDMQARVDALTYTNGRLRAKNAELEELIQPLDQVLAADLNRQAAVGGYKATRGRGIKIFIKDKAGRASNPGELVMDADFQIIVNGLWAAGAQAIEINNMRITAGTSIRNAGKAVLIDYQPIQSPYTIKAIGPQRMRNSFEQSPAGVWVRDLNINYPIDVLITSRRALRMKAGTIPTVMYAEKVSQ